MPARERELTLGPEISPRRRHMRGRQLEWIGPEQFDDQGNFLVSEGALKKYDTPRGPAKEFKGSSIIAFPSPEVQAVTGRLAQGLMRRLADAGVDQYFGAVLPEDTHHATITEAGHDMRPGTQRTISDITRRVNSEFELIRDTLTVPDFSIHGQPVLVGRTSIVLFTEPNTDEHWETVYRLGSAYYDALHGLGGDQEIAPRHPDDLVGHITLAYLAQERIPPEDYAKIREVLGSYRRDPLAVASYPLDTYDLCQYDSMAEWKAPLERLSLSSR